MIRSFAYDYRAWFQERRVCVCMRLCEAALSFNWIALHKNTLIVCQVFVELLLLLLQMIVIAHGTNKFLEWKKTTRAKKKERKFVVNGSVCWINKWWHAPHTLAAAQMPYSILLSWFRILRSVRISVIFAFFVGFYSKLFSLLLRFCCLPLPLLLLHSIETFVCVHHAAVYLHNYSTQQYC